jgi:hypothetical protein
VRDAQIAVAVLGASNDTYAEASWTQAVPDWIPAHVPMFHFFGGVPRLVVADNMKPGINKACFYDQVDIRATARTIEISYQGQRVGAHQGPYGGRRPRHMIDVGPWLPSNSCFGLPLSRHLSSDWSLCRQVAD